MFTDRAHQSLGLVDWWVCRSHTEWVGEAELKRRIRQVCACVLSITLRRDRRECCPETRSNHLGSTPHLHTNEHYKRTATWPLTETFAMSCKACHSQVMKHCIYPARRIIDCSDQWFSVKSKYPRRTIVIYNKWWINRINIKLTDSLCCARCMKVASGIVFTEWWSCNVYIIMA